MSTQYRWRNGHGGTPPEPALAVHREHNSVNDVTQILSAMEHGDTEAAEQLLPLVYDELRKLASARMAQEKPGQTLQATALVHEAYLRLVGGEKARHWNGRGHFFGAAAEAMRRILVEKARQKKQPRRGGDLHRVPLEDADGTALPPGTNLLALDDALARLEQHDEGLATLVKLRFFVGLTMSEAAEAMGQPLRTTERNWTYARTWLHRQLAEEDADGD